jgi:hypothetical protein
MHDTLQYNGEGSSCLCCWRTAVQQTGQALRSHHSAAACAAATATADGGAILTATTTTPAAARTPTFSACLAASRSSYELHAPVTCYLPSWASCCSERRLLAHVLTLNICLCPCLRMLQLPYFRCHVRHSIAARAAIAAGAHLCQRLLCSYGAPHEGQCAEGPATQLPELGAR